MTKFQKTYLLFYRHKIITKNTDLIIGCNIICRDIITSEAVKMVLIEFSIEVILFKVSTFIGHIQCIVIAVVVD